MGRVLVCHQQLQYTETHRLIFLRTMKRKQKETQLSTKPSLRVKRPRRVFYTVKCIEKQNPLLLHVTGREKRKGAL